MLRYSNSGFAATACELSNCKLNVRYMELVDAANSASAFFHHNYFVQQRITSLDE